MAGNIIRDHRSMALTSVRSGILIFSCEERLRSRAFLGGTLRSWLCRRGPLTLLYWIPELSSITEAEFLASLTLVVISFPATSLWISSVVSRMFPWESTCEARERESRVSTPPTLRLNDQPQSCESIIKIYYYFFVHTKHNTQAAINKNAESSNPDISTLPVMSYSVN